ncbi:MAG TPA: serine/threonine-protein kinase [Enhygromyxa sp.]|nr:serine/threonine-protein kinase [Enhygromyxa sp.]
MAGSPTAAWLPKRPELAPADVSGPRFASAPHRAHADERLGAPRPSQTGGRATRPFRFGSENRPDPDPPLGVGSVIGDRYQILRLLGEGGMGRVYEAQHIVLRRRVALKLLRRDAGSEAENLARFRQEALAASRIGAPEIVEVVDFASQAIAARQQTYMVMELLAGESLEDWMDRSARLDEGLLILASLCDGLAAAHRAAVVHRDIKPANVFLPEADATRSSQARVKILDFGIAKITAGGEGFQTRQGALLGTPYYLAPERVMGAELTGAADLYSVGVILYEMLTGNVPFVADSFMGILANHVHTLPLDPRQAAPERAIPDVVAQLCMRLLDKDPRVRPSAEQVGAELRSLLAQQGGVLRTIEVGPRGDVAVAGVDTQVISEATRELSSDAVGPVVVARSGTQIGHAPAATSATLPVVVPSVAVPRPAKHGLAVGLGAALAVVTIVGVTWLTLRDARTAEPQEPSATQPSEVATEETPTVTPESSDAALDGRLRLDGRGLRGRLDRLGREPAATVVDRKRTRPSKQKSDPKPAAESSDDPAPEPDPEPPQADPPKPEPEPGSELPTIKDDVYD